MNEINLSEDTLAPFCKKNRIKKLSLFGSYEKKQGEEKNDIDFLVEFFDDAHPGLLDIARMERELSEIFGKKVDWRTPEEISEYFRVDVVKEAAVKYEAGR